MDLPTNEIACSSKLVGSWSISFFSSLICLNASSGVNTSSHILLNVFILNGILYTSLPILAIGELVYLLNSTNEFT